jgi:uncharacterized OsmC-like protein
MYRVDISSKGGFSFNARSKDGEIVTDTKGGGMTPPDVLLASLGSCIGVYIRKYAEGARIELGDFAIRVEAELSKEKPVCFRKIDISVDLKDNSLDDRRKKSLRAFIENCPVHKTIKSDPEVVISL